MTLSENKSALPSLVAMDMQAWVLVRLMSTACTIYGLYMDYIGCHIKHRMLSTLGSS